MPRPSLADSAAYCRRLAQTHYENFTVASWLLPGDLAAAFLPTFTPIAAGPTIWPTRRPTAKKAWALLDWWEGELRACYAGRAGIRCSSLWPRRSSSSRFRSSRCAICWSPFGRTSVVDRYETFDELLDYCRHSANPVGRLVLYLGRSHDDERGRLADSICTGLQLANFWQDVAGDWHRGAIYLPQEDCRRFGYRSAMFERRQFESAAFEQP